MEAGSHSHPGELKLEREWAPLSVLDSMLREKSVQETFLSTDEKLEYSLSHLPPEESLSRENVYIFSVAGGQNYADYQGPTHFAAQIIGNVAELEALRLPRDLQHGQGIDMDSPVVDEIWDDIAEQMNTGLSIPDEHDLAVFKNIVDSWVELQASEARDELDKINKKVTSR